MAVFSLLSLFLFPCFLPARSFADTPAVTPSITIGNSGTLAFSVDPGSFAYGSQDITVLTTNYTGYTLTAVPSSNDSRLANSTTGSYISSIEEDVTSSGFDANEYGFSTDSTITSSTTYHPVTTSTEIKRTNSATTTQESGTFQLTIGAKAGSNTPAGTYSRTFTLTAVANPIAFAITYNANAGQDTVTNMPSPNPQTTGEVSGTNLTLSSATPTRDGYTFLGWDTNSSATTASYQPEGTFTLNQTTSNQVMLYAIWEASSFTLTYDANGGTFVNNTSSNSISYQKVCNQVSVQRFSHTSNINDDGTRIGNTAYSSNLASKEVITIPGATKLHATITYGTEDSWDMLYVFQGEYSGEVSRNMSAGQLQTYMGGDDETTTVELDISGDTATFAFSSDSSAEYWGYYANVVGYDANNNPITESVCNYQQSAGTYEEPTRSGYIFLGWSDNDSATSPTYTSELEVNANLSGDAGDNITLYAVWETPYTLIYDANGGTFTNNAQYNSVYYQATCNQVSAKNSHTSNIDDDGTQIEGVYDNNLATKDVISIPGATKLHATITYGTEDSWDMLYVFQGEYSGEVSRNMSAGQLQTYMGGNNETTTVELDISGDTATFAFYSDSSTTYWGYYANVVGYDANNNPITESVCNYQQSAGTYKEPTRSGYIFLGWSDNDSATSPTYTSELEVNANLSGDAGDITTLYAFWAASRTITVTYGSGVSNVSLNNTALNSGDSIDILEGTTVPLTATLNSFGYILDWSATSGTIGDTSARSTTYTVGNSDATITVSTIIPYMQDLTLSQCSSYANDANLNVIDRRDGSDYTVRYLNNQCWMTQNLRITGIISATNSNFSGPNFNISAYDLANSTNCGNTIGFTTVCSHFSSGDANTGNKPTAWYNYAAATAGTITGSSNTAEATEDICPSGWRLPTQDNVYGLKLAVDSDFTPFQPVYGGFYWNGSLSSTSSYVSWWSSTAGENDYRYNLRYYADSLEGSLEQRDRGYYVRCVKKNPTHTLTVNYGADVSEVIVNGQNIANNGTITMEEGVPLSINATFPLGYVIDSWSATSGTLESASAQSTTYTIGSSDATLTVTGQFQCVDNITGNMQDALPANIYCDGATGTMTDNRTTDTVLTPLTYTVFKYSNRLWMTQNLAITGTIPSSGSNFSGSSFNVSEYDLTDSTHCTYVGASDSNPLGYSNVCSHYYAGDANTGNKPTAWYNYAAVTAGTITGYSNTADVTSDICPSGWRLQNIADQNIIKDAFRAGVTEFNIIFGGTYSNGSNNNASISARWWSTGSQSSANRWAMAYAGSALTSTNGGRAGGYFVRCVRS